MLTATLLLVFIYRNHKNKPENIRSYSFSDLWFCKILFLSLCLSLPLSLSQDPDFIIKVGNLDFESIREILSATQTNSMATNGDLRPNVIRQLAKELKTLDESPPEGIKVIVDDEDLTTIFAEIDGPAGTPYENGVFRMMLCLSNNFPNSPPKGYFQTKIFHPNVSTSGEICVNTLKRDWNPTLGLRHILVVFRCLLIEPFAESALNEQACKMLLENYEEYARFARLYTEIHALRPKNRASAIGKPLISSSTNTSANGGVRDDENTDSRPNQMTRGSGKVIVKKKKKKKVIDDRKKSLRRL